MPIPRWSMLHRSGERSNEKSLEYSDATVACVCNSYEIFATPSHMVSDDSSDGDWTIIERQADKEYIRDRGPRYWSTKSSGLSHFIIHKVKLAAYHNCYLFTNNQKPKWRFLPLPFVSPAWLAWVSPRQSLLARRPARAFPLSPPTLGVQSTCNPSMPMASVSGSARQQPPIALRKLAHAPQEMSPYWTTLMVPWVWYVAIPFVYIS